MEGMKYKAGSNLRGGIMSIHVIPSYSHQANKCPEGLLLSSHPHDHEDKGSKLVEAAGVLEKGVVLQRRVHQAGKDLRALQGEGASVDCLSPRCNAPHDRKSHKMYES